MLRFHRLPSRRSISLHTDVGAPPPDAFGPFRVLHQVGVGILGPVFRAYDPEHDRLVAVKLFRLDEPPDRAHRLVAELELLIAHRLAHPVIAAPLAAGLSETSAYLVTEFASADSADLYFRGRTHHLASEVRRVVSELAGALDCARAAGIWHGALHPRDVLVTEEDVRLTGLGIAQALHRAGIASTARRPYAAPERLGDGSWTADADTFSLGALAFEFLAGRRIVGLGADAASWLPEVDGADVSALRSIFARVLAAEPGDRYGSAGEFSQVLGDVLSGKASDAPRPRASRKPRRSSSLPGAPVSPDQRPAVAPPALGFDDAAGDQPAATVHETASVPPPAVLAESAAALPSGTEPGAGSGAEPAAGPTDVGAPPTIAPSITVPAEVVGVREPVAAAESGPVIAPLPVTESIWAIGPSASGEPNPVATEAANWPLIPRDPPPAAAASAVQMFAMTAASNKVVWPLVLALVVGVAIGFAGGYATAGRRAAIGATVREMSDEAVTSPAVASAMPGGAQDVVLPAPLARGSGAVLSPAGHVATEDPAQPGRAAGGAAASAAPEARSAAGRAGLIIQSRPAGARVFVDGALVGTTPVTLTRVAAGRHDVRIERDGYRPWSRAVKAVAGGRQRVTASLVR